MTTASLSPVSSPLVQPGRREVLVKVSDVSFHYPSDPDKPVLTGVNAEIRNILGHGQVVGFLGPSGCGKTTLANIMAGVLEPTNGTVTIQQNSHEVPVQVGMMGLVWQNYPLMKHRTVRSNLEVVGQLAGQSSADATAKANQLLELFGLPDKGRVHPKQLSGGQRQRVAIAQQLMRSSHYILMDEPFSGLDPGAKAQVVRMIRQVADLNELNTFVIITHDVTAAVEVADTLWLMGRNRDASGQVISGARIVQEYDLISMGLAWHEDVQDLPGFQPLTREIKKRFETL